MGCMVKKTKDGQEIDVHVFDTELDAMNYVVKARGYKFVKHETWGFTKGFDIYQGPKENQKACIRFHYPNYQSKGYWQALFWEI